jgi:hypothetical protein
LQGVRQESCIFKLYVTIQDVGFFNFNPVLL